MLNKTIRKTTTMPHKGKIVATTLTLAFSKSEKNADMVAVSIKAVQDDGATPVDLNIETTPATAQKTFDDMMKDGAEVVE